MNAFLAWQALLLAQIIVGTVLDERSRQMFSVVVIEYFLKLKLQYEILSADLGILSLYYSNVTGWRPA